VFLRRSRVAQRHRKHLSASSAAVTDHSINSLILAAAPPLSSSPTSATKSARNRHADAVTACRLLGDQRTWLGRGSKSEKGPKGGHDPFVFVAWSNFTSSVEGIAIRYGQLR
jgi:hypothetical protein